MNEAPQEHYHYYPKQMQPKPGGGLAIAGFVLSLIALLTVCIGGLSVILAILGLVFSCVGCRHGLGVAGIVLSIITLCLNLAWVFWLGSILAFF